MGVTHLQAYKTFVVANFPAEIINFIFKSNISLFYYIHFMVSQLTWLYKARERDTTTTTSKSRKQSVEYSVQYHSVSLVVNCKRR